MARNRQQGADPTSDADVETEQQDQLTQTTQQGAQSPLAQVINRNQHQPEIVGQFRFLQVRIGEDNVSVSEPMPEADAERLISLDGFSRYVPTEETEAVIRDVVRKLEDEQAAREDEDRIVREHADEVANLQKSNLALAQQIRRLTLQRDDLIAQNNKLRGQLARFKAGEATDAIGNEQVQEGVEQ